MCVCMVDFYQKDIINSLRIAICNIHFLCRRWYSNQNGGQSTHSRAEFTHSSIAKMQYNKQHIQAKPWISNGRGNNSMSMYSHTHMVTYSCSYTQLLKISNIHILIYSCSHTYTHIYILQTTPKYVSITPTKERKNLLGWPYAWYEISMFVHVCAWACNIYLLVFVYMRVYVCVCVSHLVDQRLQIFPVLSTLLSCAIRKSLRVVEWGERTLFSIYIHHCVCGQTVFVYTVCQQKGLFRVHYV